MKQIPQSEKRIKKIDTHNGNLDFKVKKFQYQNEIDTVDAIDGFKTFFTCDEINFDLLFQKYCQQLQNRNETISQLKRLNQKLSNVKKNLILLHNYKNIPQIIFIENFNVFHINKFKPTWKLNFYNMLIKIVPSHWILDICDNLGQFIVNDSTLIAKEFGAVYIKTINSITKEKIKIILNKKYRYLHMYP